MSIHVLQLFAVNTAAKILQLGLETAQALGLPVTTWRAGDPTRSLYHYLAEVLAAHDSVVSEFIKAGFLSSAVEAAEDSGSLDWLTVLAKEMYGVTVPSATYATCTVTLTNGGGGYYPRVAGEITVRSTATGATFHNTNAPGPLSPGAVVTYDMVADAAGSDSSVGVGDIDDVVTTMLGVTVVSNTAGYGADAPTPRQIEDLCNATLGALSPNGAPDAYEYVCLSPALTGTTEVSRAFAAADGTQGRALVYVASTSGPVSSAGVQACQDAVEQWCTPLGITPTVESAVAVPVSTLFQVVGEGIPAGAEDLVEAKIAAYLASLSIQGTVATSALIAAAHKAVPQFDIVTLLSPTANIVLVDGQVATLGTVTVTEV